MNNLRLTLFLDVPGQHHDATHARVSNRSATHREDSYLRPKETEDFSKSQGVNPNLWHIVIHQYRTLVTGDPETVLPNSRLKQHGDLCNLLRRALEDGANSNTLLSLEYTEVVAALSSLLCIESSELTGSFCSAAIYLWRQRCSP